MTATIDSVVVALTTDDGTITVEHFFATGEFVVTDDRPTADQERPA